MIIGFWQEDAAGHDVDSKASSQRAAIITNNQVFSNTADSGGGLYLDHATAATLSNNAINSNTADFCGGLCLSESEATLNGVLWFNNGANTGGAGSITVTHEYTGNPAFAADGYHLTAGSAAINRGIPAGVTTDIDGETGDAAPDLGADEFPLTERAYLPIILRNR